MKTVISFFVIFYILGNIECVNAQQIFYVTQTGSGIQNGTSWSNAYGNATFRIALKTASYGTEFWIATGNYYPENNRDSSFKIPGGVKLYGGFPSTGNPLFNSRNWNIYPTFINGDLNNDDLPNLSGGALNANSTRQDNSKTIIKFKNTDSNTVLDGFMVKNGNNNTGYGSAILNDSGSCTIINCSFITNGAVAIYNSNNSKSIIQNCLFNNNYGSIHSYFATFQLTACEFTNNDGKSTLFFDHCNGALKLCNFTNNGITGLSEGGAVSYFHSTLTFDSCTFTDNYANSGADVYGTNKAPIFTNCLFKNKRITNGSVIGGDSGLFYNCNFNNCKASGAPIIGGNYPRITKCSFIGVKAGTIVNGPSSGFHGFVDSCDFINDTCNNGAIFIRSGAYNPPITNCKFIGNRGIVIYNNGNNSIINNCIFRNNTGYGNGVAIYNADRIGELQVLNSTFENNISKRINSTQTGFENGGGAIYINDGIVNGFTYTISGCNFISDSSYANGGAIYFKSNKLIINDCIFDNNVSKGSAGAIYGAGIVEINNSVFRKNHSKMAGALSYIHSYSPPSINTIRNCTFVNNYSDSMYGCLYINPNSTAGIGRVYNSIFWGNKSKGVFNHAYFSNAKTILQNNIIQTQSVSLGDSITNINTSNYYCIFKDSNNLEGSDSVLRTADDGLSVISCSPAINAGDSNLINSLFNQDISGNGRIYGSNIDIGAYEFQEQKTSNTVPYIHISTNDNYSCKNKELLFKASIMNGGNYPVFQWRKNGQIYSNNIDSNFFINGDSMIDGDTIRCFLRSSAICSLPYDTFSNPVIVHLFNLPETGSIYGENNVLVNSNKIYNVTNKKGSIYNWIVNKGAIISGNSSDSILVQWQGSAGLGFVKVNEIDSNGCSGDTISLNISIRTQDSLSLDRDTVYAAWAGDTVNINVLCNLTWIAGSSQSWATISPTFGNGNGAFIVNTLKNTGPDRIALITVEAGTITKTVFVSQLHNSTGINNSEKSNYQISVYPNPTSGLFTVYFNKVEINGIFQIYNSTGELIKEQHASNKIEIDLTEYSKGVYLLLFNSGNEIIKLKLVKE